MQLFGVTMLQNIKNKLGLYFNSAERILKTFIYVLIPPTILFLIMSDRNPYNYVTFAFYAIETILILIYVIRYHSFIFDCLSLFLVVFLFSIFLSQVVNLNIFQFPRTIVLLCLFSIIFYQFLATISLKEKEFVFKLIILGGILFLIYFVAFYFKSLINLDFSSRLGRDFSDQNDLAKNLGVFAVASEVLAHKTKRFEKICYIFATLFFSFIMLVTGSISNLLVLLIVTIVLLLCLNKGKRKLWAVTGILIFLVAFFAVLQLPFMSYFKTRITNMFESFFSGSGNVDYSFVDRFYLAIYGLRLFISKPIFGYGYNQVQYYTWGKNAFSHNNYVELLGSFGVIGFIIFEIIMFYPFVKNIRRANKELPLYTLLYLILFQAFLIIFRKKIEYFIIPLSFSFIEYPVHKYFSISLKNKKIVFKRFPNTCVCFGKKNYYSIDI